MYQLDRKFERRVAVLCATHKMFWLRIGNRVVPDQLSDEVNKNLVKLARVVANDHGWSTEDLVCQRAALWMDEGKIDEAMTIAIGEAFAEMDWEVDIEQFVLELVEPVRRHMMQEIAAKAIDRYKNGSKFGDLADLMTVCDNLGQPLADIEVRASELGEDTELLLEAAPISVRIPTGVSEIDAEFYGGLPLGTLTTILMDSKAGKTHMACFMSAVAAMHGENVGYLSLEVPTPVIHSRILAAIVGVPINDLQNPKIRAEAIRVWKDLRNRGKIGKIFVDTFPANSLDEKQVVGWFDQQEKAHEERIRFRVLDYGDIVASSKREDRESDYNRGKTVWVALANMAKREDAPNWVVTPTQSKRPESKPGQILPMLTRAAIADSAHKYRISDFLITGTPQPDMKAEQGYLWYIDADRYYGKTGTNVGVVPHERHLGRMADIAHLIG
ncbi:MAG: hypothetical protein E6Q97_06505 [Desulfurellales bacterium]|nr:MAG: hypothetical protein E6Q97_06505 [Desulfurellales bacterium]